MTDAPTPPTWNTEDVAAWAAESPGDEQLGTKEKRWVTDETGDRWLFKYAREFNGETRGEDWAEWVVHHLAELLGIPTATLRPATYNGLRGVISQAVLSPRERLVLGNELLQAAFPSYDPAIKRENPGYTVSAVQAALADVEPPRDRADLNGLSAFDVWAGYLLLDAWVAGRDRHHENWAIIRSGSQRWLAPSFDHGNALGFQVTDVEAEALLADDSRLQAWVVKGKGHHFAGRPGLVALAAQALDLAGEQARRRWMTAIAAVDSSAVHEMVSSVPDAVMSEPARKFCTTLLDLNRRRLLDGD